MKNNRLGLKIQFASIVARFKRKTQTKNVQKGSNSFIAFFKGIVPAIKINKIFFFAICIVVFGYIFFIHIDQYLKIIPQRYIGDTAQTVDLDEGPQRNVLLVGFDTKEEYRYANLLILLSLDYQTSSLRVLAVNPNYVISPSSGKEYTLFALWNNLKDDSSRMQNFIEQIELFAGLPIDRYVAFDISSLSNIINGFELSVPTYDNFKGKEIFYTSGMHIAGNDLVDYLFPHSDFIDDQHVQRHLEFVLDTLRAHRSLLDLSKAFWGAETLTTTFRTDMEKGEYLKFVSELFSAIEPYSTGILNAKLSSEALGSGSVDAIIPNYIELDETILKTFRDLNITREQAKIEIYNASNKSGVATKYRRLFQNIGGTVINIGNYPEAVDENYLYIPRSDLEKFTATVDYVEKVFDHKIKIVSGDYRYNYSGDLIIVIGSP